VLLMRAPLAGRIGAIPVRRNVDCGGDRPDELDMVARIRSRTVETPRWQEGASATSRAGS